MELPGRDRPGQALAAARGEASSAGQEATLGSSEALTRSQPAAQDQVPGVQLIRTLEAGRARPCLHRHRPDQRAKTDSHQ